MTSLDSAIANINQKMAWVKTRTFAAKCPKP
jgi:hypothetical protein